MGVGPGRHNQAAFGVIWRGFSILDGWGIEFSHALDLHVSVLKLTCVVGFEENCANQTNDAVFVREDADDIGAAFYFLVEPFQRVRAVQLGAVLGGEGHVGEYVGFGIVHKRCPASAI